MLKKPKLSCDIGSITIKANIEVSGKETEKYSRTFSQSLLSGWSFRNWCLGFYSFRAIRDTQAIERERNL